jgi:DNA-binding transcriptional ArsR family regulator
MEVQRTFKALADPHRLRIVELLAEGPLPVGAVGDKLGIRQPQTSKHLRALADAGIVDVRPDAQRRICSLRAQPLRDLDHWLARYRDLWEAQFERLDQLLADLQTAPPAPKRQKDARAAGAKRR